MVLAGVATASFNASICWYYTSALFFLILALDLISHCFFFFAEFDLLGSFIIILDLELDLIFIDLIRLGRLPIPFCNA
jgi:hypothetical protein